MPSEMLGYIKQMMEANRVNGGLKVPTLDDDYLAIRAATDAQTAAMPVEPGVTFNSDVLGGIEVEISTPQKLAGDAIIYYIHGGACAFGNAQSSRPYASALSGESGLLVYSVSYRLAPEHPFPAAPDDCFAVYQALLGKYPDRKVVVLGESAGAYLTLTISLMAKDRNVPLPACLCVFSPCTDIAEELPSRLKNKDIDLVLRGNTNEMLRACYLCGQDPHDPYISPLYGNFEGFPPIKIVVDKTEILYDDSALLAEKAQKAGVTVDYQEWDDTFHTLNALARATPESEQILRETVSFIRKHTQNNEVCQ
ncbi:MAG: alpha/beta hydrolase [Clostridiales bacterium]|nr:alpha/beta hydrolase [Clostridiales bacterium]